MINTTWEQVVDSAGFVTSYRLKVPGGWLVQANQGITFLSDSTYAWVGSTTTGTSTGTTTTTTTTGGTTTGGTSTGGTTTTTGGTTTGSTTTGGTTTTTTTGGTTTTTTTGGTTTGGTTTGSTTSTTTGGTTTGGTTTGGTTTTTTSTLYYIYKDGVQNSWRDYSYSTDTVVADPAATNKAISAKIGAYQAVSFNNNNDVAVLSQNYLGVQLDIKSDGKQAVSIALFSDQSQVAAKSIVPTATWETITVLWTDLGLLSGATFTNVLVQNPTGTALANAVEVNNVALIVNPNPAPAPIVLPPLDPAPVAANTNGALWLSINKNKIVDSTGAVWMGRGVNVFDCYLDGSGVGTAQATGAAEAIRRIDFAYAGGCDYFRLLLQAFDSNGKETAAGQLMNNAAYLAAVKTIVNHIGTLAGARVELTIDIDASLSPQIGGAPTVSTAAVLTQLVYSFYKCSNVSFGICNEPSGNSTTAARLALLAIFNQCVAAVRTAEAKVGSKNHLVMVQGIDNYAREVLWYVTNPVTDSANLTAYECHIYDATNDQFWSEYQTAAASIPLVCGEFGVVSDVATMTAADVTNWMAVLEKLQTSYTSWACDPKSDPAMLVDNTAGGSGIGMTLNWNVNGLQVINAIRAAKGLKPVKADNTLA